MTQGDTAPGLLLVLYDKSSCCGVSGVGVNVTLHNSIDFPTTTPSVTSAVDLSSAQVSVLCKMRALNDSTNIFSVFLQKVDGGSDGGVLLQWPLFSTDVDEGNYEIETIVFWGPRVQTAIDVIPVYIRERFPTGGLIADDENVVFRGGKIYIRNTDTGEVNGLSIVGTPYPSVNEDDGEAAPAWSSTVTAVDVRVVSGGLYMVNQDTGKWHALTLKGSPTAYFEVSDAIDSVSSCGAENLQITTSNGKFYVKNLDTSKWHQVRALGADGSQTIAVGDGETL